MTSPVDICNMAIAHFAGGELESLSDRTPEGKACRLFYEPARKEVLSAFDWSFARQRKALALHADDPPEDWEYAYQFPAAPALKMRRIWNPAGENGVPPVPYNIELSDDGESKKILCNLPEAIAIYTADVTNPDLFDEHFVKSLSYNLAAKVVYKITRKSNLKNGYEQLSRQAMMDAPVHNANEEKDPPPPEAPWIIERGAYPRNDPTYRESWRPVS